MSKDIISEIPAIASPSLATAIGINAAIIVQKIRFWCSYNESAKKLDHYQDGEWWTYNTREEWQQQFPWLCQSSVNNILARLRELGIVVVGNYNKTKFDHTLWYRVDEERYDELRTNGGLAPIKEEIPDEKCINVKLKDNLSEELNNNLTIPYNNTYNNLSTTTGSSAEIFKVYEQEIGMLTEFVREEINDAMQQYSSEWIIEAIKEAVANNARNWKYASAILKRWKAEGYKSTKSKPRYKKRGGDEFDFMSEKFNETHRTRAEKLSALQNAQRYHTITEEQEKIAIERGLLERRNSE